MDIATGTQGTQQKGDFPNGVPCASDASMSEWMGYVYQQQAMPTNFTGVPVQIAVLDSNGNHYSIGTATTDASGMYTLTGHQQSQATTQSTQLSQEPTATGHHQPKQASSQPQHTQPKHQPPQQQPD